ncbi:MAG: type IV toxin-antitoxin system AbiEi family antitoxin domain-containing protein [Proteobacteria bacterium]|nr:type IV toxin-antitoxin system AbiEi family antitoxin domain-containing protein [Pseudomonadota bacterium]
MERILELAEEMGVLRARDMNPYGIPRVHLSRLCAAGKLQRIARGLYALPDSEITEHHTLVEAYKRVPKGVVCLLSALQYHIIPTQTPFEVWLAIGEKAWKPRIDYPPLRIMRFSQATLNTGVEEHRIEGVPVRVFARVIPSVAYTDPEIAWVGVTEIEAKEKGIDYKVGKFPWAASGRALGIARGEGFTKLLFNPETDQVIGAGIVGVNAGELISECALAIEMGAEAADIGLTIHPHPTLSETVAMAAEAFEGTITDLYIPKRI